MPFSSSAALALLLGSSFCLSETNAHGMLTSPRSRNVHAFDNRLLSSYYEQTALNNNNENGSFTDSVCGRVQGGGRNFDSYRSGIQASYSSGQVITVGVTITVFHKGHFEFALCPANDVSRACFARNKLTIVKDNVHNAPLDGNYPHRAMLPPREHIMTTTYSYNVRLPSNLSSGDYVLRWSYVTGNSCVATGYSSYPFPASWGQMYATGMSICGNYDVNPPSGMPEVFVNCAEVRIGGGSVTVTAPTPTPPTPAPPSSGTCGNGSRGNGICADKTCCSQWGWCGCTSEHCVNGQTCGSPVVGTCMNGNRGNGICPDPRFCCSPWGWCGCSSAHCTNGQQCLA